MKTRTDAQRKRDSIKFYKEQISFSKKYSTSPAATRRINTYKRAIEILTSDKPESFITRAQKKVIGQIVKTAKGYYSYSGKIVKLEEVRISVNEHGSVSLSLDTIESTNGYLNKHIFAIIGRQGGLSPRGGRCFEVRSFLDSSKAAKVTTSLFLYEMSARETRAARLANEAARKRYLTKLEAGMS
jgi:hypothetical protein